MRVVKIEFCARVEKQAMYSLQKVVDHHIEELVDLNSWTSIESIWNAKMNIVEEDTSKKYNVVSIGFMARVDEDEMNELAKAVDHHLDWLLYLDCWPEIISVFGSTLTDICDVVDYDNINGGIENE